jgi:hypothetical protein
MGRYLRDARWHAQKIDYYHDYGGKNGYAQAEHHWNKLYKLMSSASRSKNDTKDAQFIWLIIESRKPKMDEMKKKI